MPSPERTVADPEVPAGSAGGGPLKNAKALPQLPDFIAVGPPRTATTWLDLVLRGHVSLPGETKETHFFTRNYGRGIDWYARHFRCCVGGQVVGEICPSYFASPQARERIRVAIPGCRIICTLRDPVDRLYSYYKLMRQKGQTKRSFKKALRKHRKLLDCSRYAFHVREWQATFGADHVLILLNDDLVTEPQNYLDRITDFIGIPTFRLADTMARKHEYVITNAPRWAWLAKWATEFRFWLDSHQFYRGKRFLERAGAWRLCCEGGERFPPLNRRVKAGLRDLLKPEVEALELLLHRNLSAWKGTDPQDTQTK